MTRPIPFHFGPYRRAFYAHPQFQQGWCPVCRELPIPASTDKRGRAKGGRYTCQRKPCMRAWALASQRDCQRARRLRLKTAERRAA